MDIRPPRKASRNRWLGIPSWAISTVLHALLLLLLALIGFSDLGNSLVYLTAELESPFDGGTELLEFHIDSSPASDEPPNENFESESIVPTPITVESFSLVDDRHPMADITIAANTTVPSLSVAVAGSLGHVLSMRPLSESLSGRSLDLRQELLVKNGGSKESEQAVQRALMWIAAHQSNDGGWSFAHSQSCDGKCDANGRFATSRNGATAIALLPFLGAGHTHKSGAYTETVDKGLRFLVAHINRTASDKSIPENLDESWYEQGGTMYSHSLSTIALCEAYAMSGDSFLRPFAQSGLDFLVRSQNRLDGGWRYAPGAPGDTSAVGWAVMALKSGKIAGLSVPDDTFARTNRFLDRVSSGRGTSYGYMAPDKNPHGLAATTAIGVLCRMYHGWQKSDERLTRGVNAIAKMGPDIDRVYYNYYATQVMHHFGGERWEKWNNATRDAVIHAQIKEGHASGSWTPNQDLDGTAGGRLYATAMATMILEVYYRHMPLYTDSAVNDDFPL